MQVVKKWIKVTNIIPVSLSFQKAKFSAEASIKLEASSFNSGLSFGNSKLFVMCSKSVCKKIQIS